MTVETTHAADQKPSAASVLAKLATFFQKSVSEADLKDIEQITSVVDDHIEPHTMPTREQADVGPGQSMRGGAAPVEVARHSNLMTQEGITEMYEKFDSMMGQLQKSLAAYQAKTGKDISTLSNVVKGIADSLTAAVKAEKDDLEKTFEEKDSAEKMAAKALADKAAEKAARESVLAAAFRKARISVRKAEDMDEEEEDKDEMMEKANAALAILATVVTKAEEDAEDDKDEEKAEKARQDLRALKSSLKKIVAKKAKTETPAQKPVITKDDISAALSEWAAAKGVPMSEVFATFGQRVDVSRDPPTFAKAYADKAVLTVADVAKRIEDAADSEVLRDNEILKAESLKSRLAMVQSGKYDANNFYHELTLATPNVQAIFTLPKAA
jgi:hypothetical protein